MSPLQPDRVYQLPTINSAHLQTLFPDAFPQKCSIKDLTGFIYAHINE